MIYICETRCSSSWCLEMPVFIPWNSTSSFLSFPGHLPMRLTAIAFGWVVANLVRDFRPSPPSFTSGEVELLRTELGLTRVSLEEVRQRQEDCGWQVWTLRWSLRVSCAIDCLLVFYLVYRQFCFCPSRNRSGAVPLSITADTGSTSDSDEGPDIPRGDREGISSSGGSTPKSRARPTRPSDLRVRQQ